MRTYDTWLRRTACRFGLLAAILGQLALARAVLADGNQNYVQSQRQQAADAASLPEFNPYGSMSAASISPFVGTTTSSQVNVNFPSASASVSEVTLGMAATAKGFVSLASGMLGAYAQEYGPRHLVRHPNQAFGIRSHSQERAGLPLVSSG